MTISKLIHFTLITVLSTVITSCGKPNVEKDINSIDNAVVVQGDRSQCKPNGPLPINNSLIGVWDRLDWSQTEDIQFRSFLEFKSLNNTSTITFTNYCTAKKPGRTTSASVTTQVFDNVTSYNVAQSLSKTINEKIGDINVSCTVALQAGTYKYEFDNLCLVVEGVYYIKQTETF